MKIEVKKSIEITEQDIDDVMSAALTGIGYWCDGVAIIGEKLGEWTSEHISQGGTLWLYDAEDGTKYELTRSMLMTGIAKYISEFKSENLIQNGNFDTWYVDAEVGDAIVQLALFGEIIYG